MFGYLGEFVYVLFPAGLRLVLLLRLRVVFWRALAYSLMQAVFVLVSGSPY